MIKKLTYKMKPPVSATPRKSILKKLGVAGLWAMNENGGLDVCDGSGLKNDGIITGASWSCIGKCKFGSNLEFSQTDYVTIDNTNINNVFDAGNSFSIVVWFNIDSTSGGWTWIFCKGFTSWASPYYQVDIRYDEGSGWIEYNMWNNAGGLYLTYNAPGSSVNINTWYQAALVYDGIVDALYAYLNGKLVGSDVISSGTYVNYNSNLAFGSHLQLINANYGFNGKISNGLICNLPLSASDVSRLYARPFYMFDRPAQNYFHVAGGQPPAITPMFMDLGTMYWTVKKASGLYTRI